MPIQTDPITGLVNLTVELESGAINRYTLPPADSVDVPAVAKGIRKLTERIQSVDELNALLAEQDRERHAIDNEQRQAVVVAVREGAKPPKGFKRRIRELDEDITDTRAIRNAAAQVAHEAGIELRGLYEAHRAKLESKAIAEATAAIESTASAAKILAGAQARHAAAVGLLGAFARADATGVVDLVHGVSTPELFAGGNALATALTATRAAIGAGVAELDRLKHRGE